MKLKTLLKKYLSKMLKSHFYVFVSKQERNRSEFSLYVKTLQEH